MDATSLAGVFGETLPVLLRLGSIALRRRFLDIILAILSDNQTAVTALLEPEVLVLDVHVRQHELPDLVDGVVDLARPLDLRVPLRLWHFGEDIEHRVIELHHDQLLVSLR